MIFEINKSGATVFSDIRATGSNNAFLCELAELISENPRYNISPNDHLSQVFEPYAVGLCLTNKCNLACVYCHADSGPTGDTYIQWHIAKAAVDFSFANAVKHNKCLEVTFPGTGEPTQAWSLMTQIITYIENLTKHHEPGHKISMSTNGVFPVEYAEYITDHFTAVSLSFDGPKDIQDIHRLSGLGEGTFSDVIRTAQYFLQRGFLFSIRATVSQISVDRMSEIWDFFESHFPGVPVGFERMNPLGRGHRSELRPPSIERFNSNFERLLDEAHRHQGILLNSGVGKLNQLRTAFCKSLSYPCMTITPTGYVTACQRDGSPVSFYYGKWNPQKQAFDIDLEKVSSFRSITVHKFPECTNCFAKYHCAGDCYDLRLAGIRRCQTNKRMILKDILHKLDYDKSITSVTQDDPRYQRISQQVHHS